MQPVTETSVALETGCMPRPERTAAAGSRSSIRASSTISSTRCARTKSKGGKAPADRSSTWCCAATPSMSSTEPSKATKPSAFPVQHVVKIRLRQVHRRQSGRDHADHVNSMFVSKSQDGNHQYSGGHDHQRRGSSRRIGPDGLPCSSDEPCQTFHSRAWRPATASAVTLP